MEIFFASPILNVIIGGVLIGLSAAMMFLFLGRLTGVSGIVYEGIIVFKGENRWRWGFLAGLLLGGIFLQLWEPRLLLNTVPTSTPILVLAGLLVGFGTRLGGGCTSGHGICGVGRLSVRSIVATLIFVAVGMLVATLIRRWGLL